ncbi:MAG TPA: metallophosphoesterase [Blastocatellia bacterium]|nr:metallophosphoesterase [Blastocatellia bacterium]
MLRVWGFLTTWMFLFILLTSASAPPQTQSCAIRVAVIGDYGLAGEREMDVANLVKSWSPDLIITTGDNNYENGAASTIDANIGQFYHGFIFPYFGIYGGAAASNRFFPSLGNHDWNTAGAQPYLNYFTLPGNERYYDFVWGPVHFFVIDSDAHEPDGVASTSTQANWLRVRLASATEPWKLVYFHHSPYSSGLHGSIAYMQWPFQAWGATAVLTGHDHLYERIIRNGFPYFVNGAGGGGLYEFLSTPVSGSEVRYNADNGAMMVDADTSSITFRFISRQGLVADTYVLRAIDSPAYSAASDVTSPLCPDPFDTTGVFRPTNGALYLKNSNSSGFADLFLTYGLPGDYPVAGDWNGDGIDTIGVYRAGSFYLRDSNTNGVATLVVPFGLPGDQPVVGDWNGDGIDTIGVYRNGTFMLRNSNSPGAAEAVFTLGVPGDVGIAGDWNGDGIVTTGVFRPSNGALYLKNTNTTGFADILLTYGLPGDKPIVGDWNGDGIDTIGVYRGGTFHLRNSNTNGFAELVFTLGVAADLPIAGDWDGLP